METEDAAQPANPTTEIARNGNVILVIGPQQKRIRVCSVVLSNASRYFQAMFGPHFSEGRGLTSNPADPKEIEMSEDDAHALELVCCIIHVRNDLVPNALAPQKLVKFLATADKFECLIAMRFIGRIWVAPERHYKRQKMEDIIALIISSCALDHAEGFNKATCQFIQYWDGEFMKLPTGGIHLSDDLLWHIIYALAERRVQAYLNLLELHSEEVKNLRIQHDLNCSSQDLGKILDEFREGRVFPQNMAKTSIWGVRMRIVSLEVDSEHEPQCCPSMKKCLSSFFEKTRSHFLQVYRTGGL